MCFHYFCRYMSVDFHIRNRLSQFSVGIAGCGGLGSNCAVALARVGIGRLVVADFDQVESSNLNRQYFFADQVGMPKVNALEANINRIDPGVAVETHLVVLDAENIPVIFKYCDVVVEAFDRAEMKQMIMETVLEKMPEMPLVCGMGLAGWGEGATLGMHSHGQLFIFGDMSREVSDRFPPLAPRVGVVANMQANHVLEILLGKMHYGDNSE